MYLKSLTLRGFKSFASATTLRLEPGITCVVGPNGSGKSNVVDALAWVMGEQGARAMRGGNMADVIFAGAGSRPALGRAQVDLTIDNSDGLLDIEYSEVTISRTLFRGGGSEYQINGAPARLLDVQELLSDTGMGRQMHVIVGQGQLDAILSSTPEERRGFIEEAAGVLKHRRRKERALKKLADMDANLVRVLDLTNEIHRQLGPLARQARTARRAHVIQARVRDARARLLADDLVAARERLDAHSASEDATARRRAQLEGELASARERLAALTDQERQLGPRVEEAGRVWTSLTTITERLRGTHMAAGQKVALRRQPEPEPSGEDPQALDEAAARAGEEDARLLAQVEVARTALVARTRERGQCEDADEAASRRLALVNARVADHRERAARLAGDVATAVSRHESAQGEAERAHRAADAAIARRDAAEAELAGMEDPSGSADGGDAGGAAGRHRDASRARDEARVRVDALLGREREARAERARWESRRDTLAQSLQPADETADLLGGDGVLGLAAESVRAEPGFEDAAAALLSPYTDAVVVADAEAALEQLERAKRRGGGMIRMVVAEVGAGGAHADADAARAAGMGELPEGVRPARGVVSLGERAGALAAILEGAVVAAQPREALAALRVRGVRVAVTRGGDVFGRGTVTGSGARASSTLALRASHEEAVQRAEDAAAMCEDVARELDAANNALDAAVREANTALRELRAQDAQRAKAEGEYARAASAAKAAEAEARRAQDSARRADDQVEWALSALEEARERAAAAESVEEPESVEDAQAAAAEAVRRAKEAREAETRARLELRALEERSRQVQARARSLRQAAAREREARASRARREAQRRAELERALDVEEAAAKALAVAEGAVRKAAEERSSAERERTRLSEEVARARRAADQASAELGALTSAAHRDEVARAELRMRVEHIEARAVEELSIEADALVEEFGPHMLVPVIAEDESAGDGAGPVPAGTPAGRERKAKPEPAVEDAASGEAPRQGNHGADGSAGASAGRPFVRAEQEEALRRAKRDLEKLGRVNPLALEEHEALAARHKFLVDQVQDLKSSKADLLRIVEDVDRRVEEAFTSAFADTREQFAHTFSVLFPGGTGDMVLTDSQDMLTTGIEIEAKPAGKKVKRLSLLSGGERSLAAIAFLVAIFKARPSPFYVMDEVEAALDDVNLSRLLTIFKELQQTSQLIVVTHQKRTMEIADALYGVTMRDGVTTVVSQRLEQRGSGA
ncbi:chromosome segregation protein SMC [Schaalia georgiae]|nr:chromosome segregation protein SMC [Schaalia georgiae]